MAKKFRELKIGEVFEFASIGTHPYSGMARGPWRKISARGYVAALPSHRLAGHRLQVGSINVAVEEANPRRGARGLKVSRGDLGPSFRCVSCNRKLGQLHGVNCRIVKKNSYPDRTDRLQTIAVEGPVGARAEFMYFLPLPGNHGVGLYLYRIMLGKGAMRGISWEVVRARAGLRKVIAVIAAGEPVKSFASVADAKAWMLEQERRPWNPKGKKNPVLGIFGVNPKARVVRELGRVVEVRYKRKDDGGLYFHKYTSRPRLLALSDGSIWIKGGTQ